MSCLHRLRPTLISRNNIRRIAVHQRQSSLFQPINGRPSQTNRSIRFLFTPSSHQRSPLLSRSDENNKNDDDESYETDPEYQLLIKNHNTLLATPLSSNPSSASYQTDLLISSHNALGCYFWNVEELQLSLQHHESEMELLQSRQTHKNNDNDDQSSSNPAIATNLHKIGSIHSRLNNRQEAFLWFEKALLAKRRLYGESSVEVAKTLNGLGVLYLEMTEEQNNNDTNNNDNDEKTNDDNNDDDDNAARFAYSYLTNAESILRDELNDPDHVMIAVVCNNLAKLNRIVGRFGDAIEKYDDAIRIKRFWGHCDLEQTYERGDCYFGLNMMEDAKEAYEDVLRGCRERKTRTTGAGGEGGGEEMVEAMAHYSLGLVYSKLGNLDLAVSHMETSWDIKKRIYAAEEDGGENHVEIGDILNSLGAMYGTKGDHLKSVAFFKESLRIFRLHAGDRGDSDAKVESVLKNMALVRNAMSTGSK